MTKKQESLQYYPLAIRLSGKVALVVGGGNVAQRKIEALFISKVKVRLASPVITPKLEILAKKGKIEWLPRYVKKSDIKGADIVIAATDNKAVNEKVSRWAGKEKAWINVVDKPLLSDFISPAVFRTNKSIITVYSDGKDPVLSRDLKDFLKEHWNDFLSYRNRL